MKEMRISTIVNYIGSRIKAVGDKSLYAIFLLYHAYQRKETPFWAKNIIVSSIAYLLSPIDVIPDLTPFLGFTDDISVIMFGVVTVACFIDEEVRLKARNTLGSIVGKYDMKVIEEVDSRL